MKVKKKKVKKNMENDRVTWCAPYFTLKRNNNMNDVRAWQSIRTVFWPSPGGPTAILQTAHRVI